MYAQSKAGRFYLSARRDFFSRRFLEMIDSEVSLGERIIPTKGLAQMGAERRSPEPTPGAESPASRDA
jgi:hypothetical protein